MSASERHFGIVQQQPSHSRTKTAGVEAFAAFAEPGYVKIAWTLRADPDGQSASIFRSETRAIATDPSARARFRLYWSCLSPGIVLIRRLMLGPLKAEAERRVRRAGTGADVTPGRGGRTA